MALIAGADVVIELYLSGAWTDLTCDTTSAEWTWGAPEALGPLTECEGGTLRVSLYDPARDYDPDNPDSPLLGVLLVGLPMRVTVDGQAAWTGALQTWGWDRGSSIADLNALDPIGMLSVRALPDRQTLAPALATTASQAQYMLDLVEWPVGKRFFPDGTSGVQRANHVVEGPSIDGLHRIRFAELGRLFPLRDGGIGWYDRNGPASTPPPSAVINCGGAGLTDMWRVMGLGRLRNRVVISGGYGVYGPVLPPDQYRSVTTTAEFLQISTAGGDPFPWDTWANTILDALNPPPPLTVLGTILPQNAEVAQVVCSEFGDWWTVAVEGEPDTVVQVLGQRVSVAPGSLEVDAVTEDALGVVPKVLHTLVGVGAGHVTSSNTISYANARAGIGTVTPTVPTPGPSATFRVGQLFSTGPTWDVFETFMWFDTSSIPVGATVTKASFAALLDPGRVGSTHLPFTIEVRSGYAWRPTLLAADYRPGAGLSALPLRASWNTANGNNFQEFEDAGSGLAGAIVKGGETQLVIVSARTVSGTAPVDVATFEDTFLSFPRLRVYYTLP